MDPQPSGGGFGSSPEGAALRTAAIGFVAALGIIALGAACGERDSRAAAPPPAERSGAQPVDASYTQVRDDFASKIDHELAAFDRRIDELRSKATSASADVKAEVDEDLDRLADRRRELGKKLSELRAGASDRWEDFKAALTSGVDDMKVTIDRVASKLK